MYPRVIRLNKLLLDLESKGVTRMRIKEFEELIKKNFGYSVIEFYIREGIRYDIIDIDTKKRLVTFKPLPMATIKALYREGKRRKLKKGRKPKRK